MKIKIGNAGGLGNRLYAWETMYEIAKINNAELECDFPEMNFIYLPNTNYVTPDYENFLNNSVKNYLPFNSNNIIDFKLDNNFNHYATCGFGFNRHFDTIHRNVGEFPKRLMILKDDVLLKKIKDTVKNCVGVHIRRGEAGLGNHNIFNPFYQGVTHYPYGTIPDFWYTSIMIQIKEKYPDIKFYISSDATNEELKIFYDNFDIISYKDILVDYNNDREYWKDINDYNKFVLEEKNGRIRNTDLPGLVDLFSLANSKLLICSVSTWSMTAYEMTNLPTIYPQDRNQKLDSIKKNRCSILEETIKIEDIL